MARKPLIQVFWEGLWSAGRWSGDGVMLVFCLSVDCWDRRDGLVSYVRVGTAEGLVCISWYSDWLMVCVK